MSLNKRRRIAEIKYNLSEEEKEYTVTTAYGVLTSTDFEAAVRTARVWLEKGVLDHEGTSPEVLDALENEG